VVSIQGVPVLVSASRPWTRRSSCILPQSISACLTTRTRGLHPRPLTLFTSPHTEVERSQLPPYCQHSSRTPRRLSSLDLPNAHTMHSKNESPIPHLCQPPPLSFLHLLPSAFPPLALLYSELNRHYPSVLLCQVCPPYSSILRARSCVWDGLASLAITNSRPTD
jgi:hypothetical protein